MNQRRARRLALAAAFLVGPLLLAATRPIVTSGSPACHGVALTFDLCPVIKGRGFDPGLVSFLARNGVPATFFPSGRWIERHDRELRELLAVPFFEIGTHGEAHAHLPEMDLKAQQAEIAGPALTLAACYDRPTWLFRPPYGEYNDATLRAAGRLRLQPVLWSLVSGDPDPHTSATAMIAHVRSSVRAGGVLIFHANGHGVHTLEAIREIVLHVLPQRRLTPMTVSQLLECVPDAHP